MSRKNDNPQQLSFASLDEQDSPVGLLEQLLSSAEALLVKKLSRNDRSWSWGAEGTHQAGAYIPSRERDSRFFPEFQLKQRKPGEAEIREVFFNTFWPETGETLTSRLVHYTSKGEETHLTRISKRAFQNLSPASFLVIGRMSSADGQTVFHCLTIDSASDDILLLRDSLSLPAEFVCEILDPRQRASLLQERQLTFLEMVLQAFLKGQINAFAAQYAQLPEPAILAARARQQYCQTHRLTSLNPFELQDPGNVVRDISRDVEWELFKDLQLKARSLELLDLIVGRDPKDASIERVITSLINNYQRIDAVLLSASQQRKSRAGASFENHIEQLLIDGNIPFEKQVVLEAKRRPDFILPSLARFRDSNREKSEVLVLSAKTTLRERWKQVQSEIQNCSLFLATVDENVAGNAIEDMRDLGIVLVVPETLRKSEFTDYSRHSNVIDFKTFFETEVRETRLAGWLPR